MKNLILLSILLTIFVILCNYENSYPQPHIYKVTNKILIGGENRWDYLSIDRTNNRLFVSNSNKVHVIDLKSNSIIGELSGLAGVHGIEFAPEYNKGFITSGRDNTVRIFDLKTLKETGSVQVEGKNPDAICYDPFSKRIFAFNHSSGNVTAIDAKTGKVIDTFMLGGTLEFAATDMNGKMYVNIEDKNAVDVFDPQTLKLITKWDISPCQSPSGMAIDRKNKRLFVVGDNQMMVVLDLNSGKVLKSLPIGEGVDGCAFDPGTSLIFSSNGRTGTITIIKEESPDEFKVIDNLETEKGARTITVDDKTHRVFTSSMLTDNDKKEFGVLVLEYDKK